MDVARKRRVETLLAAVENVRRRSSNAHVPAGILEVLLATGSSHTRQLASRLQQSSREIKSLTGVGHPAGASTAPALVSGLETASAANRKAREDVKGAGQALGASSAGMVAKSRSHKNRTDAVGASDAVGATTAAEAKSKSHKKRVDAKGGSAGSDAVGAATTGVAALSDSHEKKRAEGKGASDAGGAGEATKPHKDSQGAPAVVSGVEAATAANRKALEDVKGVPPALSGGAQAVAGAAKPETHAKAHSMLTKPDTASVARRSAPGNASVAAATAGVAGQSHAPTAPGDGTSAIKPRRGPSSAIIDATPAARRPSATSGAAPPLLGGTLASGDAGRGGGSDSDRSDKSSQASRSGSDRSRCVWPRSGACAASEVG